MYWLESYFWWKHEVLLISCCSSSPAPTDSRVRWVKQIISLTRSDGAFRKQTGEKKTTKTIKNTPQPDASMDPCSRVCLRRLLCDEVLQFSLCFWNVSAARPSNAALHSPLFPQGPVVQKKYILFIASWEASRELCVVKVLLTHFYVPVEIVPRLQGKLSFPCSLQSKKISGQMCTDVCGLHWLPLDKR